MAKNIKRLMLLALLSVSGWAVAVPITYVLGAILFRRIHSQGQLDHR